MNDQELNLKLLELAQSILSDRAWVERNRQEQDWMKECERIDKLNHSGMVKFEHPKFPAQPLVTHQDIITVANELGKFVYSGG